MLEELCFSGIRQVYILAVAQRARRTCSNVKIMPEKPCVLCASARDNSEK
jgi:hypothetical protein